MRKSVLSPPRFARVITLPLAVNAQGVNAGQGVTTGSIGVREADVIDRDGGEITSAIRVDQLGCFRRYISAEKIPVCAAVQ